MCGITGFAPTGTGPDEATALLARMTGSLAHRGPDDERLHVTADVALGFRRLAIIDLSTGAQPMSTPDGRYTIVMNGEIYNYREIRAELEARGVTFRTRSDTESLLELYREVGTRCVERLDGMFAFAIWDERERTLLLARDRLGKKPLVYALLPGGGIAFASEMKALYRHPLVARVIDPDAVNLFLAYQCVPGPRTIYEGIRRLPPAHTLRWQAGREPEISRYWSLDYTRKRAPARPGELEDEFRTVFRAAVRRRLLSDVPLGAFLSGGIDSSAVVAFMSEAGGTVRTFSIGFDEPAFSELPAARAVAERFGTDHREFIVRPDAAALLPRMAAAWDEPYADASALPTFCLCEATRPFVTVALSGDGGDEGFAGYDRYRWITPALQNARLLGSIPGFLRRGIASLLPARPRALRGLARLLRQGNRGFALWDEVWYNLFARDERDRLLDPGFRARLSDPEVSGFRERIFTSAAAHDPMERALWLDLNQNLPDDLLVKVDIASMAHGLEVRSPFLDHHLLEWAARLPVSELRHAGQGKRIVRSALKELMPPGLLDRPKQGFGIPVDAWFRGPLRSLATDSLLDTRAAGRGYFRRAEIERIVNEHVTGRRAHGQRLWSLVMFELWHRHVHDAAAAPLTP